MELIGKISLFIHILAGATTLLTGPVAIFYNFKDVKKHRLAGKIFFYAMLVVCFTSWVGYYKYHDLVFFQFLLGISIIVLAGILRGVRAIQVMKGKTVIGQFDFVYTALLGIFGVWMLGMALWHFQKGTMIAFPILFSVFGLMAVTDTWRNIKMFIRPATVHRLDWYRLHVGSMLGAFTAATTAFTVNAAHFLPWYLQWFGPTLLILPLQFYFGKMLVKQKKEALQRAL